MTFRSSDVGADCEDLVGWVLPRQAFDGLSFHVLRQIGDYADAAAAVGHEYFIKVSKYFDFLQLQSLYFTLYYLSNSRVGRRLVLTVVVRYFLLPSSFQLIILQN